MTRNTALLLTGATAAFVLGLGVTAQTQSANSGDAQQIDAGYHLFLDYCASCHGNSARGNGPVAEILRVRPANLTVLALANGGKFPFARTLRAVDGREVGAHGNPEMPVWGDAFRRHSGLDEQGVKARIEAIVKYLESIQERTTH